MLRLRRVVVFAASAAAIVLVACSGESGTATISPEAACDDAANAYCGKIDECASFFVKIGFGDAAKCAERIKINCIPSFSAAGTSATPARLSQCATDVKTLSCEDAVGRKLPDSCRTEPGTLADGTPCGVDAQCKGRLCRHANGSDCGACSTIGAAGSACERDEDCDSELACADKKCVSFGKAGSPCSATQPCLRTLACNKGTCAAPLGAGATCEPAGEGMNPCDGTKGLYCHGQTKVCTLVGTATSGSACGVVDNGILICTAGAQCKTTPPAKSGTCQAPAADGATCDDNNGPKCVSPAACVGGVCKISDPSACK